MVKRVAKRYVAKSSSPVRLQQEQMQSAPLAGFLHQRSAAKQAEY